MDKHKSIPNCSDACHQAEATAVAKSVRTDFAKLVSMFDRQLAKLSAADGRARSHILEARAAAQRGLDLSAKLIDFLQSVDAKD